MPREHLMAGVNTGKDTAVMLDIFTVPIGVIGDGVGARAPVGAGY